MSPKKPSIRAPAHLRAPTRRWFEKIASDYVLESHHLKLLQAAAEAWDESQAARERIRVEGMTVTDRFAQVKPHPCVQVQHVAAVRFAKLVRELNLDQTQPDESRPPRIGGAKW